MCPEANARMFHSAIEESGMPNVYMSEDEILSAEEDEHKVTTTNQVLHLIYLFDFVFKP